MGAHEPAADRQEQEDRVVTRHVDHGTTAGAADERAYRGADPEPGAEPDTDAGGTGSTSERAAADLDDDTSEPTRSE